MVKSRFSGLDLTVMVRNLKRTIVGLRVANIYDINNKTYLFKLRSPESSQRLLIESGIRIHTTKYDRDKGDVPSVFTLKLRRLIQKKRIERVTQLGIDRVVDIQFGSGGSEHHLLLEFYAQGNIILTDADYKIVTLLRTHTYENTGEVIAPGHVYNVNSARSFELLTKEALEKIFTDVQLEIQEAKAAAASAPTGEEEGADATDGAAPAEEDDVVLGSQPVAAATQKPGTAKKPKGAISNAKQANKKPVLKKVRKLRVWGAKTSGVADLELSAFLTSKLVVGTEVVEHAVCLAGIKPKVKIGEFSFADHLDALFDAFQSVQSALFDDSTALSKDEKELHRGYLILRGVATSPAASSSGSIIASPSSSSSGIASTPSADLVVYDHFVPLVYAQFAQRPSLTFATFDEAVDEFFSKIETQKDAVAVAQKENQLQKKLDKVKSTQQERVNALIQQEANLQHTAELIEANLEDVDNAIEILRRAQAQQLPWDAIGRIIKEEKRNGDPIANIIHRLDLANGKVTLLLSQRTSNLWDEDTANENIVAKPQQVAIEIAMSAYANVAGYFAQKKAVSSKREKTEQSVKKAVGAAESKAREQLLQVHAAPVIREARKKAWFEKFYWFITTDGFIVICGRDMQQNELIVKRHMRKGDLYVHADIHGASSCVLKNPSGGPVPPSSLAQAGTMSICRSGAWNAKIIANAWWVYHHQVSKTAQTGENLPTGSFMIRGTKNMLSPAQSQLAFGFLFKIHESSVLNHLEDRKHKAAFSPLRAEHPTSSSSESPLLEKAPAQAEASEAEPLVEVASRPVASAEGGAAASTQVPVADEADPFASLDTPIFFSSFDSAPIASSSSSSEPAATAVEPHQPADMGPLAEEPQSPAQGTAAPSGKKPRLSIKQRKLLKKGLDPNTPPSPKVTSPKAPKPAASQPAAPQISKKKKQKMKRAQHKYKDQDEEERELRIAALDASGEAKKAAERARQAEAAAQRAQREAEQKTAWAAKQKLMDEQKQANKPSRSEQRHTERTELRVLEEEEGLLADSEDILNSVTALDTLVENPHPDDIVLWAIPVCGPYLAMQNYKYKVKLTPGTSKRGKIAKQSVELFVRQQACTQRERELIKGVPPEDCIIILIGDAKVSIPSHIAQQIKAERKSNKGAKKLSEDISIF
ncbi:MAG: nuclear export mediator factor family protein [archaeon]|nr:nuclear export mediator factor family protein [archaeon]